MSTSATNPSGASAANPASNDAPVDKGKSKVVQQDDAMDEDEEEEEEEEEDDEEEDGDEDEDMEEEEDLKEIDPSAILPTSRRTRGVRVDYSTPEALAKAGLKPEEDHDEAEESFSEK